MADGSGYNSSTRTPARIKRKVKYNRRTQRNTRYPIHRLPFVRQSEAGLDLWNMPQADGYGAGCDMGTAAAQAFLKALRSSGSGGYLQAVVLSILRAGVNAEDHGVAGQLVGFFSYLDRWLYECVRLYGSSLDSISEAEIEAVMTRAANETEQEHSDRFSRWLHEREAAKAA